jgi:nucleoid-associated protein YgaU
MEVIKMAEEKKGFFKKIGDALSTKDEKAAAEAAQKAAAAVKAEADKAKMEAAAKSKELDAMKKSKEVEAAREKIEAARKASAKADADRIIAAAAAAKPKYNIIKEHTLTPDDTLSGLALHFYGHATPEYWKYIIEVNIDTIGADVKDYTPGKVIKIAELPPELKK